jgi:hypothetical protein
MSRWELSVGTSNEYYTPKYVFDALDCKFDMDVAAPLDRTFISTPARYFIHSDSLEYPWEGFVWCNPPFGGRNGIEPWLDKMHLHGNGIVLTPDRTSTTWWQKAANRAHAHLQVHGKIKFIKPNGEVAKSPSTGTTLFAFGIKAIESLYRAEHHMLGSVFEKSLFRF